MADRSFLNLIPNRKPGKNPGDKTVPCSTQELADFIGQHREELARFIKRKLGANDASEDILQDAYLRLSHYKTKETIDNPRAFLFRVVANLVIDYQRSNACRPHQIADDASLLSIPDHLPEPDCQFSNQQRLDAIQEAIAELPESTRMVFYMIRVQGHSYAYVAETLKITENMVGKHIAIAMKHCRDRLKQF